MYRIRHLIRGTEDNVEHALLEVEESLGTDLKSVLDEALQSKAPEDGQNLLTYAAAQGKEVWFLHIANQIRSRLGIRNLVKELRELDIDGAPLLFNAAASRWERSCFETARDLINRALGKGGLAEQLDAIDGEGRGLLMCAARGNDRKTFEEVLSICEKVVTSSMLMERKSSPSEFRAANLQADRQINLCECRIKKVARAYALEKVMENTDFAGMNCLHHAAEAGSSEVLRAVVEKRKSADSMYRSVMDAVSPDSPQLCDDERCSRQSSEILLSDLPAMNVGKKDRNDRTAIMLVLRNACGDYVDTTGLEAKFRVLYDGTNASQGVGEGWMKQRRIISVPLPGRSKPQRKSTGMIHDKERTVAITELMHAARGGLVSLELALNEVLPEFRIDSGLVRTVYLDQALDVKVDNPLQEAGASTDRESEVKLRSWGRALLLAAAAKRGDTNVLDHVLRAIQEGHFTLTKSSVNDDKFRLGDASPLVDPGKDVKAAVEKIKESRESLFSYAVLSGDTDAVQRVYNLIVKLFDGQRQDIWNILSGNDNTASSLACAASAPMEADKHGLTMFNKVYTLLQMQADGSEMTDLLKGRPGIHPKKRITPLMGAALSGNWVIFWKVYHEYKRLAEDDWWYESVWPNKLPRRTRQRSARPSKELRGRPGGIPGPVTHEEWTIEELHECPDGIPKPVTRGEWTIPAVMWRDIAEALKCSNSPPGMLISWREYLRNFSRKAVKVAAKRGTFTDVSNLVKEGFPLHDDYIYALLENIGDHELDIIQTVLFAVANASNPFGMAAGVSRMLRRAEVDHPMYQSGLRRLQKIIDEFDKELLDKLPHTVRGMGMALLGGQQPILYDQGLEQDIVFRLGNLAGFIVAQWMLEPSLLVGEINKEKGYVGPEYEDPLRRALDRGSKALDFLNSTLVKNYVHVKFTGTLPLWTSRNPFQPTVNEGFYKYEFDKYPLAALLQGRSLRSADSDDTNKSPAEKERFMTMSFLLRFLQGWDHAEEAGLKWNVPSNPSKPLLDGTEQAASGTTTASSGTTTASRPKPRQKKVPHTTILPGLQFSLAGILGKPGTFYQVPVIRFMFEIFSYVVMLVLFCFSVLLKEHDTVPLDEAVFYVFAAGLLWREVLEFKDGMPARRHRAPDHEDDQSEEQELSHPRLSMRGPGKNLNRMVSAFTRYVFYDTWNFLDTSTILCILIAFVFRMIALNNDFFLFHAQFFYALSAPLLFSRLLVLSQIDATLGPMTQVIWRMMSQTLRFSAFIAMVMLSFALAFYAVFHTCGSNIDPECDLAEGEEFLLGDAFGTFSDSFVTVFSSALGGPDFGLFEEAGDDCSPCHLPKGARNAGRFLMVVYMVTMTVVLLNLLIAVLSTAHDKVYANAEKEFHLARAKLIYQSARVVARRRPPAPLNLAKVALGIVVDTANELCRAILHLKRLAHYVRTIGAAPSEKAEQYRAEAMDFPPFSSRPQWKAIDGFLQRLAFAATMGVAAVVVSAILWALSLPWVAWCILRLMRPVEEDRMKKRKEKKQEDGTSACETGGDDSDESDQEQEEHGTKVKAPRERGYFDALVSLVGGVVGLAVGTVGGTVLCLFYIAGSVILWAAGILWLLPWLCENWNKSTEDTPEAMPGQEQGDHWKNAWNLVKSRNHGFRVDCEHPHFNVVPFLTSKTGLGMQHLARLTKLHDEKSKSEKDLVDVDHELADVPIDVKYISRKVEKRRDARTGGGGGRSGGGGSGVGDDSSDALRGELMKAAQNLDGLLRKVIEMDGRRRDARRGADGSNRGVGPDSGRDSGNSGE
eukprot:g10519.t1